MYENLSKKIIKKHDVGHEVSVDDIENMEADLNVKFGDEYKKFLHKFGNLSIGHLEFYGYAENNNAIPSAIYATKNAREDYKDFPSNLVVFYDIGDGSFYAVDEKDNVYFCQYGECKKENISFKNFLHEQINE